MHLQPTQSRVSKLARLGQKHGCVHLMQAYKINVCILLIVLDPNLLNSINLPTILRNGNWVGRAGFWHSHPHSTKDGGKCQREK